eukprot:SAG31_NODE_4634_length_3080_cov_2.575595_1_plen_131_part_00
MNMMCFHQAPITSSVLKMIYKSTVHFMILSLSTQLCAQIFATVGSTPVFAHKFGQGSFAPLSNGLKGGCPANGIDTSQAFKLSFINLFLAPSNAHVLPMIVVRRLHSRLSRPFDLAADKAHDQSSQKCNE